MKILELLNKSHYDKDHKCKTPDAIYSSDISSLSKDESEELEAKLHYAFEEVLAPYFK
jgi:hypothetical protein